MTRFEKRQPSAPAPTGPRTPEDHDVVTAATVGLDQVSVAMETKWGVGRLVTLCRDNARLSFRKGWLQWQEAAARGDAQAMVATIEGLKKLWAIMDAQATEDGHSPLSPEVWEARQDDGTVLAICRTSAEACAAQRSGRATVAYSLAEVARLLRRIEAADAIKREFPGAVVERVVQFGEGYAESWANSDPLHELIHGEKDLAV